MRNRILVQRRNEDLFRAYRQALKRKDVATHEEAIRAAIASPSRQFWISPTQAARYIKRMRAGLPIRAREQMHQMLQCLYERYCRLERLPSFAKSSTSFIAAFAITEEAPSFFLSYHRASTIITQMRYRR